MHRVNERVVARVAVLVPVGAPGEADRLDRLDPPFWEHVPLEIPLTGQLAIANIALEPVVLDDAARRRPIQSPRPPIAVADDRDPNSADPPERHQPSSLTGARGLSARDYELAVGRDRLNAERRRRCVRCSAHRDRRRRATDDKSDQRSDARHLSMPLCSRSMGTSLFPARTHSRRRSVNHPHSSQTCRCCRGTRMAGRR